ncbi:MAG TPA: hypothetical protein V6C98_18055 [Thermosynechococcaceae cyanobacterium]|jgi:hypothetical protein
MTRTSTTFPWTIENGGLKLSDGIDRDQQDAIATIFTRIKERIMRVSAGTPDFTFSTLTTPDLIAKKLAIAVEEQCPTIQSCTGLGTVDDNGLVIVVLNWVAKIEPERVRTLRIRVSD